MLDDREASDPARGQAASLVERSDLKGRGGWGWAAGAVLLVVLLALAFDMSRGPNQTGVAAISGVQQPKPTLRGPASRIYTPPPSPAGNLKP